MPEPNSKQQPAPYLPFSTFLTALSVLKHGLPSQLHPSVFTTLSGTARSQLMSAFRFLELIDADNRPTGKLEDLVGADDEQSQKIVMRLVLEDAYPAIAELAARNGAVQQLRDEIGEFNVQGDTARKAVSFFMRAAEWSGLPTSPHWKAATKRGPRKSAPTTRPRRRAGTLVTPQVPPASRTAPGTARTVELRSGGTVSLSVDADIFALDGIDRQWLFGIIDQLRAYGAESNEPHDEEGDEEFEFEEDTST